MPRGDAPANKKGSEDLMSIGVFDSGVGGLSIHHALTRRLPEADFIYLADQRHAPYGDKTGEEIVDLTRVACETLFD